MTDRNSKNLLNQISSASITLEVIYVDSPTY